MEAVKYGIKQGLWQWRIALVVYVIKLLLAMTLGMQLYQVLEGSIGDSLELNKLLTEYNHTVISDLMNVHGGSIGPLIGQARWVLLTYLIFSVFIKAGLVHTIHIKSNSWKDFWAGGAEYFFRFFKLGLLYLVVYFVLFVVAGLAAATVFGKLQQFDTEIVAFTWFGVIGLVLFVTLVKIFSAATYSKLAIVDGSTVGRAFLTGWGIFRRQWISTWKVMLPMTLLSIAVFAIYLYLEGMTGMTSALSILIFFLIQQLVVFFRSLWKLMVYNGLDSVYDAQTTS